MEETLQQINEALACFADGFWTEIDAREEIEKSLNRFFNENGE